MEAVRAFNSELSSLYESRPPVSRAKMAGVTKAAIKAIKFYKHVVQSVEKFILKCKPEYKVPGLYVIDSVVRQSRHQFGGEKDVFGPRFTKNIVTTFQSLLKCPPDEKGRIVRVLNLWQKNGVFPVDVIQSLLDMAADPKNMDCVLAAQRAVEKVVVAHQRNQGRATNGGTEESLLAQQSDIVNTVTKLLQQTEEGSLLASGQEVQLQQLQLLQQQLIMHTEMMSSKSQQTPPLIDNNLLAQIKLLTDQLLSKTDAPSSGSGPVASLQDGSRDLQNMNDSVFGSDYRDSKHMADEVAENRGREFQNMLQGDKGGGGREVKRPAEPGFNKKLLDFDYGESDEEDDKKSGASSQQHLPGGVHKLLNDPSMMQHIHNVSSLKSDQLRPDMSDSDSMRKHHLQQQQNQFNKEIERNQFTYNEFPDVILVENPDAIDDKDNDRTRRSRRSRERSRSPRRRGRSRSRSRERRRSRDRHRRSRSRDQDREKQREKERERKKKGLPPIKDNYISICSTTLWFGHLAKYTSEDELRSEIENYGTTESIKMVPPRGCAFVTMTHRKEAAKALDRLKGFKLNSSALRVAWAPNIGIKESQYKDFWDVELGVTYIPWERMPANLSSLLKGAMIDEDSLPQHLRGTGIGQEVKITEEISAPMEKKRSETPTSIQMPTYGTPSHTIPSSQQMAMIPPPMMMPPQGQIPQGVQIPPSGMGQMPLSGQMMPTQNSSAPQGLPPNLLQGPGGPVSTPISLPAGMSITQMVSAAASLLGGVQHTLPNSSIPSVGMDSPMPRMPPSLETSSPMMMPGQQPGITVRPGLPPGSPFGLPNLRPGLPIMNQGLRLPFQVEEPKEWPSDDKLEEEALAEMEDDDIDQRTGLPGPPPQMMPYQLMRMGVPGPGGPRMPLQQPGGTPRPGMMVELRQPVSSPGIPMIPGPPLGRPNMLGPRLISPAGPPDGADGMLRPPETMLPPGEGMMRPSEGMMRPGEGPMRPGEVIMRPGDGMMRPGDGMMRPGDGMMRPGDGMMRPGDGMMRPGDGVMRPGDGMMRPGDGMMRPGDGMMRPGDGGMRPGDGMMRPGEGLRPPSEGMMEPPEGMTRPGEGMLRPGEGMMQPPEGIIRPSEGMMPPGDGMIRPPDGIIRLGDAMMRPGEGMMRPGEPLLRPGESLIRPGEGLIRPSETLIHPGEGMIHPGEGMMRPGEGMMRPGEGMMRPGEGMIRPGEGMIRPGEGIIRPGESMIRPGEGMLRAQLPQGFVGMRLRMGGQGPPGLNPANLTLGPRLGMPGGPGMRPPIRIVLGQRPNLVRPGGPFGLENPRLHLGDLPVSQAGRNLLDDGPPSISLPNRNNGPQGPRPLPNLMIPASLAEGRPGLLGPRPNLPVGGMRFGPGAINLRGLRPDFLQGPAVEKPSLVQSSSRFSGGPQVTKSPSYGEGNNSPEYGTVSEERKDDKVAAEDTDLRGDMDLRGDRDLRSDTDLRPKDTDLRKSTGSESAETASESNAPGSSIFPAVSQEDSKSAFSNSDQTSDALEEASKE